MSFNCIKVGAGVHPTLVGRGSTCNVANKMSRLRAAPQQQGYELVTEDTPGVDALLDRDFKEVKLNEDAFAPAKPVTETPKQRKKAASSSPAAEAQAARELRADAQRAAGGPARTKDAIAAGLKLFEEGKYLEASEMFQTALELPGSGFMRLAGSPKEYACPSDGEEQAALYNMACCYCKLSRPEAALTCLEALLEGEFEDFNTIRTDPDLAPVRGPELDKLLAKHDSLLNKVFGKKKQAPSGERSWLQRW